MPRRTLPLTATELQKAKPRAKDFKLFDGGGLYLLVTPSGGKLWNMKYNRDGKEKKISIGAYPAITLIDARQRREEIKAMLVKGIYRPRSREKGTEAGRYRQSNKQL